MASSSRMTDDKYLMEYSYWKETFKKVSTFRNDASTEEVEKIVKEKLKKIESSNKASIYEEAEFIATNFHQRRCLSYCKDNTNEFWSSSEVCVCGMYKEQHMKEATINWISSGWTPEKNTQRLPTPCFGNLDIPSHDNFLEAPSGMRKFVRLGDVETDPAAVWTLLTKHWQLKSPNMVLSITGGDVTELKNKPRLHRNFREGLIKTAATTSAWIFTEGLYSGSSREIGDIFQEDLKKTEWGEKSLDLALIAITPWGILADKKPLYGMWVGNDYTEYLYQTWAGDNFKDEDDEEENLEDILEEVAEGADKTPLMATQIVEGDTETRGDQNVTDTRYLPNSLDPHHTCYLFADDGRRGQYRAEPNLRTQLEKYIAHAKSLTIHGSTVVKTPVIVLVVGGDKFTMGKVADCVESDIAVVIVNESGPIPELLADVYHAFDSKHPLHLRTGGWTDEEETTLQDYVARFKRDALISSAEEENLIRRIMKGRSWITVFGIEDGDINDLDKAILEAIFCHTDIAVQLNLTLAMDRCDVAEEAIFIESRHDELKEQESMIQSVLYLSLKSGRQQFSGILLDQDYGSHIDFREFLTIERLYGLHRENLNDHHEMSKILRSLTRRRTDGRYMLNEKQLLPQVGRIIHELIGNKYRLLYQEENFTKVRESSSDEHVFTREEAVWHLFLWAVLANQKSVVELFIYESSCKIGAALIAFQLFTKLAESAERLNELEMHTRLKSNAGHFQDVAIHTLSNLYHLNKTEAYACLVSALPFHWARYVTPLSIADSAQAMKFMGHACCQTYLNLVWRKNMDMDSPQWTIFPIFALFPFINLPFIIFDMESFAFGSHKKYLKQFRELDPDTEVFAEETTGNNNRLPSVEDGADQTEKRPKERQPRGCMARFKYAVFVVNSYYTAPINTFLFNFCLYIVFLGLYTNFLISKLEPYTSLSDIPVENIVLFVWILGFSVEELKQIFTRRSSGPLLDLDWKTLPAWSDVWGLPERISFVFHLYKVSEWLSDRWNVFDALMLTLYYVSVALFFTLPLIHFGIVRIFFVVCGIIFYFRVLRYGYILQNVGPRIITIAALLRDLFYFLVILSVFIVSFGVAFHALIDPHQPASYYTLSGIIWRSYWQMYGELFVGEDGLGWGVRGDRNNCTSDWDLASAFPDQYEYCHEWVVPVMLGIFLLITNVLLLNLLIAIFSASFDEINTKAKIIWQYHIYDLVYEYYHLSWLPVPLNMLCHLANLIIWIFKKMFALFRCTYRASKSTDDFRTRHVSHFWQQMFIRDDNLEERAFKRYKRSQEKGVHSVANTLGEHSDRLIFISSELADIKEMATTSGSFQTAKNDTTSGKDVRRDAANDLVLREMQNVKTNMDQLSDRMDTIVNALENLSQSVESLSNKKKE